MRRLAPPPATQVPAPRLALRAVSSAVLLSRVDRRTGLGGRSKGDTTLPISSACMRRETRSQVSFAPRGELPGNHRRHHHRRATMLQGHPSRLRPLGRNSSGGPLPGAFLSSTGKTRKGHARPGLAWAGSFPSARAQGEGIPNRASLEPAIDAAEAIQLAKTRHPIVEHVKEEDRCLSGKRFPLWSW